MTRCLLSETHIAINPMGEVNPCCRYTPSSDERQYVTPTPLDHMFLHPRLRKIRKNLKDGIRDEGCRFCWDEEDIGTKSMRQSDSWLVEQELDRIGRYITGEPVNDVLSIEIAFSNHCNMKCRHCKTSSSSRWREDDVKLGRWVPDRLLQEPDVSKLELHKFKNLRKIKILGGEPLLSKQHTAFISQLTDSNIIDNLHIEIITNGSIFPNDTVIVGWRRSRFVDITVSLDDVEEYYDYFRTDGKFDVVKENMKRIEELDLRDRFLSIHIVVNAMNIYRMSEIFSYFGDNFPKWRVLVDKIHEPLELSLNQWSRDGLIFEIERLEQLAEKEHEFIDNENIQRVISYINGISNEMDFSEMCKINSKLDKFRNTYLFDVHPIFKQYIGDTYSDFEK